jgi:uncharacterized protein
MSATHGKFVWIENLTADPDRALNYYTEVVGWDTESMPMGDGAPYVMWKNREGRTVGGLMKLPAEAAAMGAPNHWLGHVASDDLDGTIARVRDLGGQVLNGPVPVPGMGRFAILRDPQGVVFASFEAADGGAAGPVGPPVTGDLGWAELMSPDLDASLAFYCAVFGWEKSSAIDMGPMGVYQLLRRPGQDGDFAGMMQTVPEMPMAAWNYYVMVDDLEAAIEAGQAGGGRLLNGPQEVPGGARIANLMDDQGCAYSLIHMPPMG